MKQHIEKIYCDICKKEIDVDGKSEYGFHKLIAFNRAFYVKDSDGEWRDKHVNDVCETCYVKICDFQTKLWNAFNTEEES